METDDRGNPVFAANAMKVRKHFLAGRRIKARHRLVGQDNLWPLRHGPGDADALLLPAGEFVRATKRAIEQSDPFERLQREEAIRPRQRKQGAQGAMRADAAEQNVL